MKEESFLSYGSGDPREHTGPGKIEGNVTRMLNPLPQAWEYMLIPRILLKE